MAVVRRLIPTLAALLFVAPLGAQDLGSVTGKVVDSASQQPLSNVNVAVEGTDRRTITRTDGTYSIGAVPVGTHRVRARRIGYASQLLPVTVTSGGTATVEFALLPQAAALGEIVVTGYGSQRREAITGSVATVDADLANVGVVSNAKDLMQGRIAGVHITQNGGEPGAGSQIRIRGGTSISGGNEPLYVIDGVPIQNVPTEAAGFSIGGRTPSQPRDPLNLINPSDIESITVLKDASATAIYGSRAANGVVLVETKKGTLGAVEVEYDSYIASASAARTLDVLTGAQYRAFILQEVAKGPVTGLPASRGLDCTATVTTGCLGPANTNWEDAVTRGSTTMNHNLAFTGGTRDTRYRASLNYMNQKGVVLSNGLERVQGRLNGNHNALRGKLRLGLNLTASQINNDYIPFENTGGFEGGVFANMVMMNPTQPIKVTGPAGTPVFYELGAGTQSVRNPVALAEQIDDVARTTRTLGNATAAFDILSNLIGQINVGVDKAEGTRKLYVPNASPVGAQWGGLARQVNRDNMTLTLSNLLTYTPQFGASHDVEIIGGYEFNDMTVGEFGAEAQGFITDAFRFDNLGGGNTLIRPFSWRNDSRLVSFFSRANYGLNDRYFVTGVIRFDGSSQFGDAKAKKSFSNAWTGSNKWAAFPAISASWRVSAEEFMRGRMFSDLRLRAGYGLQGNPGVTPYASLILLEPSARYPFGDVPVTGVAPVRNANPNLKWEQTSQMDLAVDFGLRDDRIKGTLEYYVKNTKDLLQVVDVPQPAVVSTRLENVGKIRNTGVEFSLDGVLYNTRTLNWSAGLVTAVERNKVIDLGPRTFLATGDVSGQGMSGVNAQRIIPGQPLGTFWGPRYVGLNSSGQQLFKCKTASATCVNGQTRSPSGDDYEIIGNANPNFSLGLNSRADWGRWDVSFLVRSDVGRDVFNNTGLVYSAKSQALTDRNFLASGLTDGVGLREPAIFSSRWIEDGTFVRLQNLTIGYTVPEQFLGQARTGRVYVSGDNLLLSTNYSGYDPEVHTEAGVGSRGMDYLSYPRPRTFTAGVRLTF
jgi:TonB-linked SusC/RagA family outer membrane protein